MILDLNDKALEVTQLQPMRCKTMGSKEQSSPVFLGTEAEHPLGLGTTHSKLPIQRTCFPIIFIILFESCQLFKGS